MFALIAHITMEEEPLIALIAGFSAVAGAVGAVLGSLVTRRRGAKIDS